MKGFVQIYTPRAKQDIRNILEKYLDTWRVSVFTDNILTCLDELVKNGIKANYKFIYVRERLDEYYEAHKDEDLPELSLLLGSSERLNEFVAEHIKTDDIMPMVRIVLNQEAKAISLKTRVNEENRSYTTEEKEQIKRYTELRRIKELVEKYNIKLQVSIYEDKKILIADIVNTAPILREDLLTIQKNRAEFKEYAERGEVHMFFLKELNESGGGAGLGYGTIDASLLEMGQDPGDAMKIIPLTNTTVVLGVEIDKLKELAPKEESKENIKNG